VDLTMLRATLRSLLARKLRLVLSALAVVAGVSFVAGTLVLTDTLNATFTSLFANITKNVSVDVRAVNKVDPTSNEGRPLLPASLVDDLRKKVDGARAVVGQVSGSAVLANPHHLDPRTGKPELVLSGTSPVLGINWTGDEATSAEKIVAGHKPNPGEIVVDKGTVDREGLTLGDKIPVYTVNSGTTPKVFTLVGTFTTGGEDSVGGAVVTAFTTDDAQTMMFKPGQFTSIYLAANSGLSQAELRGRVTGVLPAGVEAITGSQLADENANTVKDALAFLSTALLIFAGISVFVGAFIIFNTFTMLVAQRVRELALLRALGASRRQVQVSVQAEAALVGFVGATVGLVAGVLLARLLHAAMGAFGVVLPDGGMVFLPRTIVVCYLVGVLVTSAAAVVPAHKAATVPPIAALRDTYTIAAKSLRTRAFFGLTGAVLGAAAVVYGLSRPGSSGTPLVGLGAAVIFLGVAALSPVLARPVTRLLGAPLPRLFGVVGRIGLQNAMRNPRRTSATASALMIGLALVSAFAIFGQSIKVSVRDTVSGALSADYFVRSQIPNSPFSGEIGRAVAKVPGVGETLPIRGGDVTFGGVKGAQTLLAADPKAVTDVLGLHQVAGNLALTDGTIAMDEDHAAKLGLTVGGKLRVTYPDKADQTLTLVGVFAKNTFVEYLITPGEWAKHSPQDEDILVLVKRADGADPSTVLSAVKAAIGAFPTVDVLDQTEFVAEQEKAVDQILGLVYVLLALAVIIALFGIVNTLALSVIERTREIGLLRAVGLRRGQMWIVIVLESVVIALFGAALGVGVGSFLGWALVTALKSQGITSFAYPTATIVTVLILGGVLGVAAAVFPALRAARMNVLKAISTA
jgi:putative ABC transport system permease protein